MKQSMRKKMSITKLTLARTKYIREHFFPFVAYEMGKRKDIINAESMNPDTMIFEVGVEVLFKAICKMEGKVPEEVDQAAINEYAAKQPVDDAYVEKLSKFVELEYAAKKQDAITPEDRKKAVEAYRNKKNQEISKEWDE